MRLLLDRGIRGLGWAVDAVPTLKGGSTIGIPSPPAIWLPAEGSSSRIFAMRSDCRASSPTGPNQPADARAPRGGTRAGSSSGTPSASQSRPGSEDTYATRASYDDTLDAGPPREGGRPWPVAAYGVRGQRQAVNVSAWPVHAPFTPLGEFLHYPTRELSERATAGFLGRTRRSSLRFPHGFLDAVEAHLERCPAPIRPARTRLGIDAHECGRSPARTSAPGRRAETRRFGFARGQARVRIALSRALAVLIASALRPEFPNIIPTPDDVGHESLTEAPAARSAST